jgi:hypothetical protein
MVRSFLMLSVLVFTTACGRTPELAGGGLPSPSGVAIRGTMMQSVVIGDVTCDRATATEVIGIFSPVKRDRTVFAVRGDREATAWLLDCSRSPADSPDLALHRYEEIRDQKAIAGEIEVFEDARMLSGTGRK